MYSDEQIIEFTKQLFSIPPGEIFFLDGKDECKGSVPVYWTVGTATSLVGYRIVQVLDGGDWHNLVEDNSMFGIVKSLLFWYDCKIDIVKTHNYRLMRDLSVLDGQDK